MLKSLLFSALLLQNISAQAPPVKLPPRPAPPKSISVTTAASPPPTSVPATTVASTPPKSVPAPPVASPPKSVPTAKAVPPPAASSPGIVGAPKAAPPPASSSVAPVATPVCKVIPGDKDWPADDVWTKEITTVQKSPGVNGKTTRPDWVVNAKGPSDVQAAVTFAAKYNVRVSIVNSGHDFLGRNDAPNGIWINVANIKGSRVDESFVVAENGTKPVDHGKDCSRDINVIKADGKQQAVVTFGVGCSTQDMNNALDKSGLFIISAAASTVKPAGGFAQAAGHAPFSSLHGLGADNVVEFKVVTADGKYVIANNRANRSLFNALRGGGGGTFGVVIEATFKAHKTPRVIVTKFFVEATSKNDTTSIYDPAAYLHAQFPHLNRQGAQGYYYVYPFGMYGRFLHPDTTVDAVKKMWNPVIAGLESFPNMKKAVRQYQEFKSYKSWFDALFRPIEELKAGEALQLEPPTPHGNIPMDSWLLGPSTLESPKLSDAMRDAMPKMGAGMLRGHLTAGGKVNDRRNGAPYVNPAWRTAMVHLIGTGIGVPNITSIKQLERGSGSYSNEDSGTRERDWKRAMWGRNYRALLQIKHQVDPKGVFWATPGIGADEFMVMNGRLCNIAGIPNIPKPANYRLFAPESDNKNLGSGSSEYKQFPTQEECDQQKGACVP